MYQIKREGRDGARLSIPGKYTTPMPDLTPDAPQQI
jgi:hypothetical protein